MDRKPEENHPEINTEAAAANREAQPTGEIPQEGVLDREKASVVENSSSKLPITEEEARLLLQQETRKTEAKLLTAEQKNKKFLKTAIIIGVILCIAGIALAVVMATMRKPDTPNQGDSSQVVDKDKPEQNP